MANLSLRAPDMILPPNFRVRCGLPVAHAKVMPPWASGYNIYVIWLDHRRFAYRPGWAWSGRSPDTRSATSSRALCDKTTVLYPNTLTFEGNRAIVLHKTADLPIAPLKHCISIALTYHRRKKLPLLGAAPHH